MSTASGNTSKRKMPAGNTEVACTGWFAASQVVTWLLVVGGWIYTNYTNNKRETRKELRGALDKLRSEMDSEVELCHEYYLSSPVESTSKASTLLIGFTRISSAIQHMGDKDAKMKSPELDRKMFLFMDQLTGGDFQSASRVPVKPDAPRLQAIAAAALDVQNELERLFIHANQ